MSATMLSNRSRTTRHHYGRIRAALTVTLMLAVGIGIVLAFVVAPQIQQRRALAGIVDPDADRRAQAWRWLREPVDDAAQAQARAHDLLDESIVPALESAGDAALLDAGVELRKLDAWNWSRIPAPLLLHELELRASANDVDQHRVTLELMETVPLDAPVDDVVPVFDALLQSDDESVRRRAFDAMWMWAGPEHAPRIATIVGDQHVTHLQHRHAIALGWAVRLGDQPQLIEEPSTPDAAHLLAHALAHSDDAQPLLNYAAANDDQAAAIAAEIARYLNDQAARTTLEQLADRNIATARYALQAMDAARDQQAARDVLETPTAERWRRRLAAWRLPAVSRDQLDDLLYIEQTDPPQPVFDVALLADRHYRRNDLSTLAQQWIASLNDDEKRAGLLLHALGSEVDAEARRVARAVFNSAVTSRQSADFDPDRVLMRLAEGDADALHHLTSQPPLSAANESASGGIIRRAWLIERFVPMWHEQCSRPVGGSRAALALHFDALDALRLVTQRRLEFNRQRRAFEYQPVSVRSAQQAP